MPPTLICRICYEALHEKKMVTTKCGHMFCSECAGTVFARTRSSCPVCRKPHTFGQLIRLYPEWETSEGSSTPIPSRSDARAATTKADHYPPAPAPHHPVYSHPVSQQHSAYQYPVYPPPEPPPAQVQVQPFFDTYVPLNNQPLFPWTHVGEVPAWDLDRTPVYLGIAHFNGGWHPCKIKPGARFMARVSYGGKELEHAGMCHLLPFNPATMEWVPTSRGNVPPGRRPVEGGYEELGGDMLYHALAVVEGVKVPGKAGPHLVHGASVPYGNVEHIVRHYDILCWRDY